jgi:two-component system sensor histidine kinase/response regulator
VLAARHAESRFDALDKVPVGILVLDPEYRILFWNQCLENWTGLLRHELLLADARLSFPAIGKSSYSKRIERVFRDGVPTVFSPQLHAPFIQCEITPGVARVQYITVTSIPSHSGSGFLAVFSIQDITDLTRRLDESRRTASALSSELQRRAELQNDLHKAKDAADAANRAKSEFLANMSHEIRTPMNGILGMIGLLLDDELDARQRQRAEAVRGSAEDLLAILNDILDHSKIEARKLQLEATDFDLRGVVEEVADLVAVTAQKKGLEVLCSIQPDVPTRLRGDPTRLRQVLLNLAGNAVKFTHRGEVAIRVKLDAEDSTTVRFEVTDTGIGVPQDKMDRLFRPFSQADATTTRRYGGTGLGLSIVARLVELMGGKVGFESQEGRGSRFWFTARLERQSCEWPLVTSFPGRRVLVVDDHRASRELVTDLLGFWQCTVEQAADVETALARLRTTNHPFEAAIVDLEIPGGGAGRLAALIQKDDGLGGMPWILLTPLSRTLDAERGRAWGFARHLTKPVKQGELAACLDSVLGHSPGLIRAEVRPADGLPARRALRTDFRILLVEDNPTSQEVALGMLENLGYRADLAPDGRSALRALARTDYALVLMDCQLPDLDGYEATRLIRWPATQVRNHEIPIVAMTAHAMAGDRELCLAAGMNDYLSKPIDRKALGRAIERWAPRAGAASESPETGGGGSLASMPVPAPTSRVEVEFEEEDLLERLSGNEELAQRVVSIFLDDMPRQLAVLAEAVNGGDGNAASQIAHAIKGAAANVGGTQIRELAWKLEQLGKTGDFDQASALVRELSASFARTRAPMERFCRTEPGG